MKRCSALSVIREMQSKSAAMLDIETTRMTKTQQITAKTDNTKC